MPCGCEKANAGPTTWVYTTPMGTQQTYRTEIEARAAQIRGGGGTVEGR